MTILAFVLGLILLLVLTVDVHMTVFMPRGGPGVITRRLYSGSWAVWKRIGSRLTDKRRRGWLAQLAPILVPLTVVVWGMLLLLSFSLMYVPWASGFSISPPESGPVPTWAMVLYYSGYSSVTLGVGDVTPSGTMPRLLAVAEAGIGFALFTVAVTYLLSVYNARNQSTALALAISRLVGRRDGEDPVSLLIATAKTTAVGGMTNWLDQVAFDLAALVELRGQYPLLHYFHEPNDDRAMPIALGELLEVVTLCRSVLDPEQYPVLANGPTVAATERLGRHYLSSYEGGQRDDSESYNRERRRRYTAARERLAREGIALRTDHEAWDRYQSIARLWDVADDRMREWIGYPSTSPLGTREDQ